MQQKRKTNQAPFTGKRPAYDSVMANTKKNSLVNNINKRKKAGKSRPKSRSTVSKKSYGDMEKGWSSKKSTKKTAKKSAKKTAKKTSKKTAKKSTKKSAKKSSRK